MLRRDAYEHDPVEGSWSDSLEHLEATRREELAHRLLAWDPALATPDLPGPFAHTPLNGLEVFWLAICAYSARSGTDRMLAEHYLRDSHRNLPGDRDVHVRAIRALTLRTLYLQEADLRGARLATARLQQARLEGAQLEGAVLQAAHLEGSHLERADLTQTHLEGANLGGASLQGAVLVHAHLEGADLERAWCQGADLRGADLRGAIFEHALLDAARLEGANLRGANLEWARIIHAHLEGADLRGARLMYTVIWRSYLTGAIFSGPYLDRSEEVAIAEEPQPEGLTWENINVAVVRRVPELRPMYQQLLATSGDFPYALMAEVARWAQALAAQVQGAPPASALLRTLGDSTLRRLAAALEEMATANDQSVSDLWGTGFGEALDQSAPGFAELFAYLGPTCQKDMRVLFDLDSDWGTVTL